MSLLEKTFSIFGWRKKTEKITDDTATKEKKELGLKLNTIGGLRVWMEKELPPLALQRISLRTAKKLMEKGIYLTQSPNETIIPDELLKLIVENIKTLYNKEYPYGN